MRGLNQTIFISLIVGISFVVPIFALGAISEFPVIHNIDPDNALAGATVRIKGEHFGAQTFIDPNNYVSFGGDFQTKVLSWSDSEIVVEVPSLGASAETAHENVDDVASRIPIPSLVKDLIKLAPIRVAEAPDIEGTQISVSVVTEVGRSNEVSFFYTHVESSKKVNHYWDTIKAISSNFFNKIVLEPLSHLFHPIQYVQEKSNRVLRTTNEVAFEESTIVAAGSSYSAPNNKAASSENTDTTPAAVVAKPLQESENQSVVTAGKVTAVVMSPSGQPVYQAQFSLRDENGNQIGRSVGGITTDTARSTGKNGAMETAIVPRGKYTLTVTCGAHCMFGDTFATKVADDIYARWSKTIDVTVDQKEVDLGTVTLKKWTKVSFAPVDKSNLESGLYPFLMKIVDGNGQTVGTETLVYGSGKYSIYLPDGTYTLILNESYYKVVEKTFSVNGGSLDLGTFVMEKR